MSLESIGKQQYEKFVRERLIDQVVSTEKPSETRSWIWWRLQRTQNLRVARWEACRTRLQHYPSYTLPTKFLLVIHSNSFPKKMLVIPNQYLKMVICTMNLNQKLDLIQELIDTSTDSVVADHSSVHVIIIGGPAIIHMVQPKSNCTVDEYCKSYMKYVVNFLTRLP